MKCTKCGFDNLGKEKYCINCGAPFEKSLGNSKILTKPTILIFMSLATILLLILIYSFEPFNNPVETNIPINEPNDGRFADPIKTMKAIPNDSEVSQEINDNNNLKQMGENVLYSCVSSSNIEVRDFNGGQYYSFSDNQIRELFNHNYNGNYYSLGFNSFYYRDYYQPSANAFGFSNDGSTIAFQGQLVTDHGQGADGFTGLFLGTLSKGLGSPLGVTQMIPVELGNEIISLFNDRENNLIFNMNDHLFRYSYLKNEIILVGDAEKLLIPLTLSPNGISLALINGNRDLFVLEIDTGLMDKIANNVNFNSTIWSPDSQSIVYRSLKDGNFYILDLSSRSSPLQITTNIYELNEDIRIEDWSRDGKYLLYSSQYMDKSLVNFTDLFIIDLTNFIQSRISHRLGYVVSPKFSPSGYAIALLSTDGGTKLKTTLMNNDGSGQIITGEHWQEYKFIYGNEYFPDQAPDLICVVQWLE